MAVEWMGDTPDWNSNRKRTPFNERASWELKWYVGFGKCHETGKRLYPFTRVWLGSAMWTGPGTPVIKERWISQAGYVFLKLKGKI